MGIYLVLASLVIIGVSTASDCPYYMWHHNVGDHWTAVDGCNQCNCTTHGMVCTANPCKNTGFAKPVQGRLGDCNYHGAWYLHHDQWLAKDGCNTCVCHYPGNFLGVQVCTSTRCNQIIG